MTEPLENHQKGECLVDGVELACYNWNKEGRKRLSRASAPGASRRREFHAGGIIHGLIGSRRIHHR